MNGVSSRRASITGLAIAAVLGLGAAACGDDDEPEAGGDGAATQAAKPSRLAIELSGSAKKPTFTVPKSVEGGVVEIELTNSAKGPHGAQLIGAKDGHTPQEALAVGSAWGEKGKPLPEWALLAGGVGEVASGESSSVTQELAPGRYIVVDLETDASAEFEVTGDAGRGELTADGGTITSTEYAFESAGLRAGTSTVLFDNAGGEPHFIEAAPLKPGKTLGDVRKYITGDGGASPIDEGEDFSTAVIDGGARQTVELNLKPGKYALLCFVPDRAGGPPHALKGMISEAEVAQ